MNLDGLEFYNCMGVPVLYRVNTPDYYFLSSCVSFMNDMPEVYPFPEFFRNKEQVEIDGFKELVKVNWDRQDIEYSDEKFEKLLEENREFKSDT